VAGAPVQGQAVVGAGAGGAAAGTNKRKVPVYIDGNTVAQKCAYSADYYPMTGDVVALALVGTDKKARAGYLILYRIASGASPAPGSNTVAAAISTALSSSGVTVASFDPYAVFGVGVGLYRCSIFLDVPSSQAVTVSVSSGALGPFYFTSVLASSTTTVWTDAATMDGNYVCAPIVVGYTESATGHPVKITGSSASSTATCSPIIESIG